MGKTRWKKLDDVFSGDIGYEYNLHVLTNLYIQTQTLLTDERERVRKINNILFTLSGMLWPYLTEAERERIGEFESKLFGAVNDEKIKDKELRKDVIEAEQLRLFRFLQLKQANLDLFLDGEKLVGANADD